MDESKTLRLAKWPFFAGDAALLGVAWFIFWQGKLPLNTWEIAALGICVALGAGLAVTPYLLDYRAWVRTLETQALGAAAEKLQHLDAVAAQIGSATNHWHLAHEQAEKTANVAREISERMGAELKDFTQFMGTLNDREKGALRLEVEKLHRAENDWLQVLVRILDHVYALRVAAERSGQPGLISQIGSFQGACLDAARRVGLVPFVAAAQEPFDPKRHQSAGGPPPTEGTAIIETLAPGFTFQSRLIRPALVRLPGESVEAGVSASASEDANTQTGDSSQTTLPLESGEPVAAGAHE